MTKYYFISFSGVIKDSESNLIGCCLYKAIDETLGAISLNIAKKNNLKDNVVITCLKDLSEEEFKMLNGK